MMNTPTPRLVGNLSWDGLPKSRRHVAMFALMCGLFFSVLDGTVCNVALPSIAADLHISSSDSIWIVNAFQLVIVMMLLPFASLGELFSYRLIYLWGLVLFTGGSLCCALSPSFVWLILSRVVQGIGAAMVMSISTSLIKLIYPKKQLGRGVGLNATVVALALVLGPTLSGAILAVGRWPWLFAINVPVGLLACLLSHRYLPANPTRIEGRTFDLAEALLNMLTFGTFIGCIEALSHDAPFWLPLSFVLLFVVSSAAFVKSQRTKAFPMFPLDLLSSPLFLLSVLTSVMSFAAQMLAMVGMPFLLAHTFGMGAAQMGGLLTVYPLIVLFVAPVSGRLIERVHPQHLSRLGLLVLCVGSLLLAFLPQHTGGSVWAIAAGFAVCGAGFGLFQSPNNHLMLSSAPSHRAGSAGGMMALARLVGQTLGAACVALFFHLWPADAPQFAMLLAAGLTFVGTVLLSLPLRRR